MPTNEELLRQLELDLRAYIVDRTPEYEVLVGHEEYMTRTRADVDALAGKLRDVVTALVAADGALSARIERLDTFVMDSAFGPDPAEPEDWGDGPFPIFENEHIRLNPWQWIKNKLGLPIF